MNFRGGRGVVIGGVGVLWGCSPETVRESPWARGASVPVLLRVPTAGEGGSWLPGARKRRHPPPHPFLPSGGVAGSVEGPGQGTELHGVRRKGLFEWRGEDGVSSKLEIEGTRPLGVRLEPCRYVAPVLCIYEVVRNRK